MSIVVFGFSNLRRMNEKSEQNNMRRMIEKCKQNINYGYHFLLYF